MAQVTITLSSEELKHVEELGRREGLTVEQVIKLGIQDLISQPDEVFRTAAQRILQKNAELYRRLA